ncbi:MAG TPA: hypothetical protein VK736_04385 [Candidatus Binatia bacterium]|nr:hypothetical protein [Candidatus Binatia bacterium]
MIRNRLAPLAILLALAMLLMGLQASLVTAKGPPKILEFDTMVGVSAPFAGAANAIRGVNGAGAPWVVGSAEGELTTSGRLEIKVQGLVLASSGNNPQASFQAIVSCLRSDNTVQNISTGPFPATTGLASAGGGSAKVEIDLTTLPRPCIAPIVFVTNGAGTSWFAVTGG